MKKTHNKIIFFSDKDAEISWKSCKDATPWVGVGSQKKKFI